MLTILGKSTKYLIISMHPHSLKLKVIANKIKDSPRPGTYLSGLFTFPFLLAISIQSVAATPAAAVMLDLVSNLLYCGAMITTLSDRVSTFFTCHP